MNFPGRSSCSTSKTCFVLVGTNEGATPELVSLFMFVSQIKHRLDATIGSNYVFAFLCSSPAPDEFEIRDRKIMDAGNQGMSTLNADGRQRGFPKLEMFLSSRLPTDFP